MKVDLYVRNRQIFATRSGVLICSSATRSNRSQLDIQFVPPTPTTYRREGSFFFRHSVWNKVGQGFTAERRLWAENLWEFLFRSTVIHAEDPDGAIARRLAVSDLISVPGKIEVSEFGCQQTRSFVLMFDQDYSLAGTKLGSAGAIHAVTFREKKFDFFCRLAIGINPTGYAHTIFAIFEEIYGNISVVEYGPVLHGPLISRSGLPEATCFSDCIYEAVDTPPPSMDYCMDLLPLATRATNP